MTRETRPGDDLQRGARGAARGGRLEPAGVPPPRRGRRRRSTALTQLLIAWCPPARARDAAGAAETPLPHRPAPAGRASTAGASAAPTAVPQPESELNVYNWSYYIGRDTRDKFEQKYGIKLNYDRFPDENTQIGKLTSDGKGGGYDVSYPASTWIPSFIERGRHPEARPLADPEHREPAARMARPGVRPGQPVLGALLVVDHRLRLGSGQDPGGPDELGCALGRGLHRPAVHARRHARVLRRRRIPPRARPEHDGRRPARPDPGRARGPEADRQALHDRPHRRHAQRRRRHRPLLVRRLDPDDVRQAEDRATSSRPRARSRATTRSWSCPGRRIRSPRTSGSTSTSTRRSAPTTRTTSATWARTRPRCRCSRSTSSRIPGSTRRPSSWPR